MNTEPQQNDQPENESEIEVSQSDSNIEAANQEELDAVFSSEELAEGNEDEQGEDTVVSLRSKLADAEKRVLMAHADLENFRRRNRRDMQDQLRYASLNLMKEMLESVDNLNRATEAYDKDANGDGLAEGVKMVAQQISTLLENHGCKKIEAVGQPFDPNLHQAMQMQPSDEFEAQVVMMDLRSGFQLHERVVRPSQVFVSTGPAEK